MTRTGASRDVKNKRWLSVVLLAGLLAASSIGSSPRWAAAEAYWKADRILVKKAERRLYLLRDDAVIASYKVALGGNPVGPKYFQGDSRTPEGTYTIDARNAGSRFYRALRISYPSYEDRARARQYGAPAGGLVMIHGQPNQRRRNHDAASDWTDGCIAVSNHEMDEIWAAVDVGTPIEIEP